MSNQSVGDVAGRHGTYIPSWLSTPPSQKVTIWKGLTAGHYADGNGYSYTIVKSKFTE